ncbi:MAG: ABC transporter ATP-binding protein [Candidatus Kariarchaeaceae archaeon]
MVSELIHITENSVLTCERLTKIFEVGDSTVVATNNLTLEVHQNEFVVVMGRSGSGKSTLLGLMAGLINPTEGEIIVHDPKRGEPLKLISTSRGKLADMRRHSMGIIFQNSHLHPHLTAAENIELPMMIAGNKTRDVRIARVDELLEMVGLEHRGEHFPYELSGGEKQRIAIARSLANDPIILLADEPTGDLDTNTSREIIEILQKLNLEKNVTIVLVTHDSKILNYATRSIIMQDGEIISDKLVEKK